MDKTCGHFLYNLYIFVWIQNGCFANTVFALDPNNSVIKRQWCICCFILSISATASELDAEIMSKDMVCQSDTALRYIVGKCSYPGDCPLNISSLPDDIDLKCG